MKKKLTPILNEINGDEDVLLERYHKGDRAALFQLVSIYIKKLPTIDKFARFEKPSAEKIDFITNRLITHFEFCVNMFWSGELSKDWKNGIIKCIKKAINDFQNVDKKPNINFESKESMVFLNNLNIKLQSLQNNLMQTLSQIKINYSNRDLDFPKAEAEVHFILIGCIDASHITILPIAVHNIRGINFTTLCESNSDAEEIGSGTLWPKLEHPYCYLFDDLLVNSRLDDRIFGIERIYSKIIISNVEYKFE